MRQNREGAKKDHTGGRIVGLGKSVRIDARKRAHIYAVRIGFLQQHYIRRPGGQHPVYLVITAVPRENVPGQHADLRSTGISRAGLHVDRRHISQPEYA